VILDTSVLIAIVKREPDRRSYLAALREAHDRRLSAANYLEAAIVVDGSGDALLRARFDGLIVSLGLSLEPVTENQARIARQAYREYGKGSGHPARLNFGDCFAYALARDLDEPLLYKGDDFSKTDIPFVGRPSERRRLSELIAAYG
jgi:ribonuclease VapC